MEPKKILKKHKIVTSKLKSINRFIVGSTHELRRNRFIIEVVLDGRSYESIAYVNFMYDMVTPELGYSFSLPIKRELSIDIQFIGTTNCTYSEMIQVLTMGERFNVKIMELDHVGVVINEKRCFNCFLSNLTHSDGMDTPLNINQIEVSIKCDYFEETNLIYRPS